MRISGHFSRSSSRTSTSRTKPSGTKSRTTSSRPQRTTRLPSVLCKQLHAHVAEGERRRQIRGNDVERPHDAQSKVGRHRDLPSDVRRRKLGATVVRDGARRSRFGCDATDRLAVLSRRAGRDDGGRRLQTSGGLQHVQRGRDIALVEDAPLAAARKVDDDGRTHTGEKVDGILRHGQICQRASAASFVAVRAAPCASKPSSRSNLRSGAPISPVDPVTSTRVSAHGRKRPGSRENVSTAVSRSDILPMSSQYASVWRTRTILSAS